MLLRGCWVLLLLPLLPLLCTPAAGLLSWLGLGAAPQEEAAAAVVTPQALQPSGPPPVPFEMTLGDERFLAEAERWDPSPLDSCQHQVVAQLRSSCADLSEEEVAKLGVALFNCQASAEGRRTYPCGPDVPLERCTAAMDPDTWTAYHVVSNRARAVCYAARQLEFRRRTERAVAALAAAAASQLEAMRALKEEQAALRELTAESLQRALSGQRELLAQQERLRGSQGQMETSIHSSLEQLAQEKALLATWQHHIAQLVEGITEKMENMSHHLAVQDEGLQEGHRTVLTDLSRAQERAQDVYSKIESHLVLFLAYQNRTARGYDEVVGKLQRMNQSLELALAAVDSLRSQLESWLQHIRAVLSWAGLGPSAASTCILHGAYFLLLALLLAFLQAPALPRAALLLLVISNAAHQLRGAGSLGFPALSALLGLVAAGHRLLAATRCRAAGAPLPALSLGAGQPHCHLTSTPERYEASFSRGGFETCPLRDRLELSYLQDPSCLEQLPAVAGDPSSAGQASPVPGGWKTKPNLATLHGRPATPRSLHGVSLSQAMLEMGSGAGHHWETKPYSPSQSLASDVSSLSPRLPCQGLTRAGQQCRKRAIPGQVFCRVHASRQASHSGRAVDSSHPI